MVDKEFLSKHGIRLLPNRIHNLFIFNPKKKKKDQCEIRVLTLKELKKKFNNLIIVE